MTAPLAKWGAMIQASDRAMSEKKSLDGYRRLLLRRALAASLTALAGLTARHARAQVKPTKAQASYQDNAATHNCEECALFLPPNDCKVIQGPVSPSGTCIYFSH